MDPYQRRKRYFNFWLNLFLTFSVFFIFYFYLIRPVQISIVANVIVPYLQNYTVQYNDLYIYADLDDYWIESKSDRFINIFLNLPFNGYFWVTISFLWVYKKRQAIKYLTLYNIALFIIHPLFIFLLLNNHYWIAFIISAHEFVYKALFLSMALIAVKEGNKNELNT